MFVTEQNDKSGLSSWQLLLLLLCTENDELEFPLLIWILDAAKVDGTWCDWVLISDEIIMVAESLIASAVVLLLIYM
mgnify:CR=1 FL=1